MTAQRYDVVSDLAIELVAGSLICDMHAGFEFQESSDLNQLERWKDVGVDYLSVNAGYDVHSWERTVTALAAYRRFVADHPDNYIAVENVSDIRRARQDGKLAIGYDIEGMRALNEDVNMVSFYYGLGVRQMLIAYNLNNAAGGGCHDEDIGLTDFGRLVVEEMNRVGMLVDCSHSAYRSTMDAMEMSSQPVVFSHSNSRSLCDHERNILDEQAKAAADTGGLVAVTGIGLFLDKAGPSVRALSAHVDHFADVIGIEHIALGLDYAFDQEDFEQTFGTNQHYWPSAQYPASSDIGFMEPECFPAIADGLLDRGYDETQVRGVMGENFLRIAEQVWL